MAHFSLHSLALVLVYFYVSSLLISATANIHVLETKTTTDPRLALLSFKSQLSDPLGSLASWNDNGFLHYCMWRGITCGRRHPLQVVALGLDSLGLAGPISPVVSNLTFLRRLHLPDNQLNRRIPEELGRLSRLQHLILSRNYLQGEIPSTLSNCSNLEIIGLKDNMLGGEIPTYIGSLPKLQILSLSYNNLNGHIPPLLGSSPWLTDVGLYNNNLKGGIPPLLANSSSLQILYIQDNRLTGSIPPSFGNNTSLLQLALSSNNLTGGIPPFLANPSRLFLMSLSTNSLVGGIPPSLGNLSSIQYLYIADNKLEGSIPESLGTIPSLIELELSENNLSNTIPSSLYNISTITLLGATINMLSGTIPTDIGLTLPNLKHLELTQNQFEGSIPISLTNASGLEHLGIGDNFFSGVVPSNLGSLQNLSVLNMRNNPFQVHDWSILTSLTNCSLLEILSLSASKIEGALPSSVGHLSTRLEALNIGNNKISGTMPEEIGKLVNLTYLDLSQNLFVGSIPVAIGELTNMYYLELSGNNLSGSIPSAIGNLRHLNLLHMEGNELSGTIPASIGGCTQLLRLGLSHNALGGTIPRELLNLSSLIYVDLSYNSLIGSIPKEVARLINLGSLDVSENQLSGDLPPVLGSCQLLEELYMEGNFFQGYIPPTFIGLKGLKVLDLSRNNFSGRIPEFFNSFQSLQLLNLSFNDFEGKVPSGNVFNNASGFSVLGNKKLCGGYTKLQLPPCSIQTTHRKISLLKLIIPAVSAVIILILLSLFGILYRQRRVVIHKASTNESSFDGEKFKKVSYTDIYKATDGFSSANLVGAGSFGSVYRGKIHSEESIVAVKVLNLYRKGASRSFTAECDALRNIRHRNLVKIISACSSVDHSGNDFKALVYEYMPNGSLEKWLHPEVDLEHPPPHKYLTLIQRLNIAIDVASALDYLHHSCQPSVVHCDLKPSNVLLNNDMMGCVGDFGLARLLSESTVVSSQNSTSSMGIKGTVGYVAPEYGMGGRISTQGDVYSFGILLLEMLTGKKPTDDVFKDGMNLQRYVEIALQEGVMRILDPQLVSLDDSKVKGDGDIMNESIATPRNRECILSLIRVGLLCSNAAPRERMEMRDVATNIHKIKEIFSKG